MQFSVTAETPLGLSLYYPQFWYKLLLGATYHQVGNHAVTILTAENVHMHKCDGNHQCTNASVYYTVQCYNCYQQDYATDGCNNIITVHCKHLIIRWLHSNRTYIPINGNTTPTDNIYLFIVGHVHMSIKAERSQTAKKRPTLSSFFQI